MDTIDHTALKRSSKKILSILSTVGNSIIVSEACFILFPKRYLNRELATIDDSITLLSIYALVTESGYYSVSNIPTMGTYSPWKITNERIDGVDYYALHFEKDSVIIESDDLVQNSGFIYPIFDEFIIKANIPWFMDYNDMSKIFIYMKKYANSPVGNMPVIMEMLASMITKDANDKKIGYRHYLNTLKDIKDSKPFKYIPLESVYYSFNSTLNKVVGSYSDRGITSALVDPGDNVERIDRLLRT